jgi:protein-S-isoprenylcysteine O-methyltransferase Ste14
MSALELKVPPPLVALLIGVAMWALSRLTQSVTVSVVFPITMTAVVIGLVGGGITLSGAIAFRRAKTTVDPFRPESASSLVTFGVYRMTRNPMYVGLLMVLIGWAVFLVNVWSALGPLVFVAYITRFQIQPEERALASLFGEAYASYKSRVRRWL